MYAFKCDDLHCKADNKSSTYVGMTGVRLKRRLEQHKQNGSILQHYRVTHNRVPTKEILFENTDVLARATDRYRLSIKEALLISHNNPSINKQFQNFAHTLRLHPHRRTPNSTTPVVLDTVRANQVVNNPSIASPVVLDTGGANQVVNNSSIAAPTNNISPNIQRRISNLLNCTRNNTASANTRVLRSQTLQLNMRVSSEDQ